MKGDSDISCISTLETIPKRLVKEREHVKIRGYY